jgi:hypothetical protein
MDSGQHRGPSELQAVPSERHAPPSPPSGAPESILSSSCDPCVWSELELATQDHALELESEEVPDARPRLAREDVSRVRIAPVPGPESAEDPGADVLLHPNRQATSEAEGQTLGRTWWTEA